MSSASPRSAPPPPSASDPAPSPVPRVGFVGLGKIGFALARNVIRKSGAPSLVHYDLSPDARRRLSEETGSAAASSAEEVASAADVVFTALPNDAILLSVALGEEEGEGGGGGGGGRGLDGALRPGSVHVSCSTVSPETSRRIAAAHAARGVGFVAAPVFARPDGMALGRATIPVSGKPEDVERVRPLLKCAASEVRDGFGDDPGAANVVKLCGNFLIASAIESTAEALALAEGCGVDRGAVHSLLSETIFDCLIYRGYGRRVAMRDHAPYPDAHFALDLGRKDVELVKRTAGEAGVPMPAASLLGERFAAAAERGRGDLDWSAIGLGVSEDAGVDVAEHEARCRREDPRLDWTPPT